MPRAGKAILTTTNTHTGDASVSVNLIDHFNNIFQASSTSNHTILDTIRRAEALHVRQTALACEGDLTPYFDSDNLYCRLLGNSDLLINGCGNQTATAQQTGSELRDASQPICPINNYNQVSAIGSVAAAGTVLLVFIAWLAKKHCISVYHDLDRSRLVAEEKSSEPVGNEVRPTSMYSSVMNKLCFWRTNYTQTANSEDVELGPNNNESKSSSSAPSLSLSNGHSV